MQPFLLQQSQTSISAAQVSGHHNDIGFGITLHQCRFDDTLPHPQKLFETAGIGFPQQLKSASTGRQLEYLAGRICATTALGGIGINNVQVGSNADRSPIWPVGCTGSISHKRQRAVAVANKQYGLLGVDVEMLMKPASAEKIARKIINDAEVKRMADGPYDFAKSLTVVFSAKEALYKAIYPRVKRYLPFHICELMEISTDHLLLNLAEEISTEVGCHTLFHIYCQWQEDHVITVAAKQLK